MLDFDWNAVAFIMIYLTEQGRLVYLIIVVIKQFSVYLYSIRIPVEQGRLVYLIIVVIKQFSVYLYSIRIPV